MPCGAWLVPPKIIIRILFPSIYLFFYGVSGKNIRVALNYFFNGVSSCAVCMRVCAPHALSTHPAYPVTVLMPHPRETRSVTTLYETETSQIQVVVVPLLAVLDTLLARLYLVFAMQCHTQWIQKRDIYKPAHPPVRIFFSRIHKISFCVSYRA